ncbi:nuclear transport factor 2 family protein [Mycobacterium sp. BMJ-28]
MRRTPSTVGLATAALLLTLTGCARAIPGTAAAPPDARQRSAADQIAEVVDQFEQAWNAGDYANLRSLMCDEMRGQSEFGEDALREARSDSGRLELTITELDVTGDTATSVIENQGEDPDDITFQREGGAWKWCEF